MVEKNKNYELETNGIIVFVISVMAGLINYLYQIIMGNTLRPDEYGLLNTLLSLTIVVSLPASTLGVITLKYTSHFAANNHIQKISVIYKKISLIACLCAGITLFAGSQLLTAICSVLKINNKNYVLLVMLAASLEYIIYVNKGILQGLKKFIPFSMMSIIGALGKIIFSILLITAGFGLYGATFSLVLASIASIIYAFLVLKKNILPFPKDRVLIESINLRNYFQYVIWTQLFLLLLTSGDILLVKLFSDDYTVGIYSSVSVLCKISYYFANSIASTLLPIVAQNHSKGEKTYNLFIKSVAYSLIVSVTCAIGISLFGDFLIRILFGSEYGGANVLLVPVSFFIISLNLVTVLINYLTAVEDLKFLTISLIVGFIITIFAVFKVNYSISQLMYMLGAGLCIVFFINFMFITIKYKKNTQ